MDTAYLRIAISGGNDDDDDDDDDDDNPWNSWVSKFWANLHASSTSP